MFRSQAAIVHFHGPKPHDFNNLRAHPTAPPKPIFASQLKQCDWLNVSNGCRRWMDDWSALQQSFETILRPDSDLNTVIPALEPDPRQLVDPIRFQFRTRGAVSSVEPRDQVDFHFATELPVSQVPACLPHSSSNLRSQAKIQGSTEPPLKSRPETRAIKFQRAQQMNGLIVKRWEHLTRRIDGRISCLQSQVPAT